MLLGVSSFLHSAKMTKPSWQSGFLLVSLHFLHFDLFRVNPKKKLRLRHLDASLISFFVQIVNMFNIYFPFTFLNLWIPMGEQFTSAPLLTKAPHTAGFCVCKMGRNWKFTYKATFQSWPLFLCSCQVFWKSLKMILRLIDV